MQSDNTLEIVERKWNKFLIDGTVFTLLRVVGCSGA